MAATVPTVTALPLSELVTGVHRLRLAICDDGLGRALEVPLIAVCGQRPGPVVGLTAAVHGNEVNGVEVIHRLLGTIDPAELAGVILAVPVVNVPGYLRNTRGYLDGRDLNRVMPGKPAGTAAEVYAHHLVQRYVRRLDYLFDLHTASFGRVNSLYVRADMTRLDTAALARVLNPQIIVHNTGGDGTLRGCATRLGVCALTLEVGDPQRLQGELIRDAAVALRDALEFLELVAPDHETARGDPVECSGSFWLRTHIGGLLRVRVALCERVTAGQPVADLVDEWGAIVHTFTAPEDAVVVGRSTNPVAMAGARIVHLGRVGSPTVEGAE